MSEQNNNNLKDFLDTLSYPKGGNGGNGGGVSSWNDLTDKPFGSEVVEGPLVFDGNLEGREVISTGDHTFAIKMTDYFIPAEKFNGATVIWHYEYSEATNENEHEVYSAEENIAPDGSGRRLVVVTIKSKNVETVLMSAEGDFSDMGMPFSTGTYFIGEITDTDRNTKQYPISISCVTGPIETIKKLDEKYLPDYSGALEEQLNKIYELNAAIDAKTGNE